MAARRRGGAELTATARQRVHAQLRARPAAELRSEPSASTDGDGGPPDEELGRRAASWLLLLRVSVYSVC